MKQRSVVGATAVAAMAVAAVLILTGVDTLASRRRAADDLEWSRSLRSAESAVLAGDADGAMTHLRRAYLSALRSEAWPAMAEVGESALRVAAVGATPERARTTARQAYRSGLIRAREQRSLEGALRLAEGIAVLGDQQMLEHCIALAELLATTERSEARRANAQGLSERYRVGGRTASGHFER